MNNNKLYILLIPFSIISSIIAYDIIVRQYGLEAEDSLENFHNSIMIIKTLFCIFNIFITVIVLLSYKKKRGVDETK